MPNRRRIHKRRIGNVNGTLVIDGSVEDIVLANTFRLELTNSARRYLS